MIFVEITYVPRCPMALPPIAFVLMTCIPIVLVSMAIILKAFVPMEFDQRTFV
jgi:hypothetical protein